MTLKLYPNNNNKIRITRTKGIEVGPRDRAILKEDFDWLWGLVGCLPFSHKSACQRSHTAFCRNPCKTQLVIRQGSAMAKHGYFPPLAMMLGSVGHLYGHKSPGAKGYPTLLLAPICFLRWRPRLCIPRPGTRQIRIPEVSTALWSLLAPRTGGL